MGVNSKELFNYNNLIHAVSGAVGSMVGMVVFYPLDTVRCRLQLDEKMKAKNTFQIILQLVREEGFGTLYRGIIPVLQSICASNFVYFYVYNGLKASALGKNRTGKDLFLASIAGVINVLITTPLWMVSTRMKMSGITDTQRYKSITEGLIRISKREGLSTLWAGTVPSLVLVSNPAIYMAVYESIKRRLHVVESSAIMYFTISAISKVVATIITYPLQLIQTKLRHGHSHEDLAPDAGTLQLLLYLLKRQGVEGLYKGMEAKLLQTVLTTALMFTTYEKIAAFVLRIMSASVRPGA